MSSSDTGGPAFPHGPTHQYGSHPGMSLRQWYAGMAMQGLLASETEENDKGYSELAEMAFKQADAMLEQEGKR